MKLRSAHLLWIIPVLTLGIWFLTPPRAKVVVRGQPLSGKEVNSVRHALRRAQLGRAWFAIGHKNFAWCRRELVGLTLPLKSIDCDDLAGGRFASAYLYDHALGDEGDYYFILEEHGNKWTGFSTCSNELPTRSQLARPPPGH